MVKKSGASASHSHKLTLITEKGTSVGYVGHIAEIPEIVFQADTEEHLHKEALKAVKGYFTAFPEQHDAIFEKQKVKAEELKVTIPLKRR